MGKIIALSGVDNAGKSTQGKLLVEYWRKENKKVIITEFAFGYYLLNPLIGLLRKSTGSPAAGPVNRNKKLLPKLWFIPAFIDIWIGYIFHLRKLKDRNDVVLCDRYYTDIWANLLYYGYIPDWAFEKLVNFLPEADYSIMLLTEPEIGFKRIKDEFPLSYYQKQIKIYKRLAQITKIKVILSEQGTQEVKRKILRYISLQ